ncbi:hypothetical protein [Burkholderia sp. Ac-20365]|uniref:hypothetical protein n=1 Tax=Burkholderia sp. Ac-20365 TaxID=2703897 RepID=UPI00197B4829|nr:hypothetical protein [Burkholderia sp. Ac-20365]MBN3760910.1 hypothetical protein [Burkholderia sp. Ac-20365]
MDIWTLIEYAGSALGMLGALSNSFGERFGRMTFSVWVVSNVLLVAYTSFRAEWGLAAMQSFYLLTSLIGLRRIFGGRDAPVQIAQPSCATINSDVEENNTQLENQ